ncbi:MAG: 4Fe-4S dicluster domain-containing protein [Gammaproteobacteria bacterium]|nr:4Fe-4S dicluster domain-containing protein [Gammaproteobacteria bacterium]
MNGAERARRRFLGQIAAAAGLALAPGLVFIRLARARTADQPVTSAVRWGMLVDTAKCARGCDACVHACSKENGWRDPPVRPETDAQWIRTLTVTDKRTGRVQHLPMMCQHCEHPPCVDVCPTGASFRRADGIVLVDRHLCIGCRYCMMACPYKARSFVAEALHDQKTFAPRGIGTVESCTFCVHRVDTGRQPACVEACAAEGHNALVFGDLNDPNSTIARQRTRDGGAEIRSDLDLDTGVRYLGL